MMNQGEIEKIVIETQAATKANAEQLTQLVGVVKGLADKIDSARGVNWGAMAVFVTVILGTVAGAWTLWHSQLASVKETVGSYESRLQRVENVNDRDRENKAKMWDNYVYGKLTATP